MSYVSGNRLIDANESNTERIGEILDLQVRDMSAKDLLTTENVNSEDEAEASEFEESESDEVQVIQDGIDDIEITATETPPPPTLKQSQITALCKKNKPLIRCKTQC